MPTSRKLRIQPPPPGFAWIEDYKDPITDEVVVPGIAARLGISPSTYRKWRMRDEGPPTVVLGKKVAARIAAIEQYLVGLEKAATDEAEAAAQRAAHDMRPAEYRSTRRTPIAA